MEIRILSQRGMSIRAIANNLGVSRNTVRRYLRGEAVAPGCRRVDRSRKLGPYEAWLRRRGTGAAPIQLARDGAPPRDCGHER